MDLGHQIIEDPIDYLSGFEQAFTRYWLGALSDMPFTEEQIARMGAFTRYAYQMGCELSNDNRQEAIDRLWEISDYTTAQWDQYDAVMTPTVAGLPPKLGTFDQAPVEENFHRQCEWMPYTSIVSVSGRPAISVPVMPAGDGLAISMQFIGRPGTENLLLQLAAQMEI